MTIPTRPAPPPPIQSSTSAQQRSNYGGGNFTAPSKLLIKLPPPPNRNSRPLAPATSAPSSSITRHFPLARTITSPVDPFDPVDIRKKGPPRPPPPRVLPPMATALKKPNAPPQSVNVLSNLFGRKKSKPTVAAKPNLRPVQLPPQTHVNPIFPNFAEPKNTQYTSFNTATTTEAQLIKFDSSPTPSSPTLTQKSNSDCVSVDSFSSDSNFSSPNNGNGSQPESGFEDDFSASRATTSPADPWETLEEAFNHTENIYSNFTTPAPVTSVCSAPVRNFETVNRRLQNDNALCNGKSLLPPAPVLTMPTIIKPKISQKPKAPKPPAFLLSSFNRPVEENNAYDDEYDVDDPPMPKFAPPPPPSGIVVEDESVDFNVEPYGVALYDFEGVQDGDLDFSANEKIYILNKVNEEWLYGRNKRGCEGMFPSIYVDIKVPLKEVATSNSEQIRALYTFAAQESGDLSFNENDFINVLYRINEDWLFGEVNGKSGQFPANFLEYPPTNF